MSGTFSDSVRAPDETDHGLIHALRIAARAPFCQIGLALGVSTQTVARRYQGLRAKASLRVLGLPHPHRLGLAECALALSRHVDTALVSLVSGGAEIVAIVQAPITATSAETVLGRDVPRTAAVTAVSADLLLDLYLGRPSGWRGCANVLDDRQRRCLQPQWPADPDPAHREPALSDTAIAAAESGPDGSRGRPHRVAVIRCGYARGALLENSSLGGVLADFDACAPPGSSPAANATPANATPAWSSLHAIGLGLPFPTGSFDTAVLTSRLSGLGRRWSSGLLADERIADQAIVTFPDPS